MCYYLQAASLFLSHGVMDITRLLLLQHTAALSAEASNTDGRQASPTSAARTLQLLLRLHQSLLLAADQLAAEDAAHLVQEVSQQLCSAAARAAAAGLLFPVLPTSAGEPGCNQGETHEYMVALLRMMELAAIVMVQVCTCMET